MKRNRFLILLLAILLAFFCFTPGLHVFAATATSDVLDDLKKDESFNPNDYSSITLDDYNFINTDNIETNDVSCVNVIQIAETDEKKLYIYTYQPLNDSLKLNISSVSIFFDFSDYQKEINPIEFDLKLLSTNGVFCKYEVVDYIVSSELYRYYNIVCLYRSINTSIDNVSSDISQIAEGIGQQWCCYYYNDKLIYEMETIEVLEIKPNLNAAVRFENGFTLGSFLNYDTMVDAHFIAFDMENYVADKILNASLTFDLVHYLKSNTPLTGYEDKITENSVDKDIKKLLSETDLISFDGKGLLGKTYEWHRIMTGEDYYNFIKASDGELLDSKVDLIKNSQWVFSFTETEVIYTKNVQSGVGLFQSWEYSEPDNLTILRIEFLQGNKTYNLGVVSNKINSSGVVGTVGGANWEKLFKQLGDGFDTIFMILGLIVLLIVVIAAWPIIKFIFNGIVYILSIPFKIIDFIFPKKKK